MKSFLSPDNPQDLAFLRRLFLICIAVVVGASLRVFDWGQVPAIFWQPVSFFRYLGPLPAPLLLAGHLLFPLLCLLSAFRPGAWVAISTFVLGWILLGYGMNFGKVDHSYSLVAIALLADAVAQTGRRFRPSVDWLNVLFKFMPFAICCLYFSSGLRKLLASGPSWFASNNMQILLLDHGTSAGLWLGRFETAPKILAFGSLALELLSPLALLAPELAIFFVASWGLMHLSIFIFMGPNFLAHALTFLFWVPYLRRGFRSEPAFRQAPASLLRPVTIAAALYFALSAWQVAFKRDSWPLSSFPMYESDLSRTGVKRYVPMLGDEPVSVSDFPPFPGATLERSLRKTAEKEKWPELQAKLDELSRRKTGEPGHVRLLEKTWNRMDAFDPSRPDETRGVP